MTYLLRLAAVSPRAYDILRPTAHYGKNRLSRHDLPSTRGHGTCAGEYFVYLGNGEKTTEYDRLILVIQTWQLLRGAHEQSSTEMGPVRYKVLYGSINTVARVLEIAVGSIVMYL